MAIYRTAKTTTKTKISKLTIRLPTALQARLKKRANRTHQSLNSALVEALTAGLETVETRMETERERTLRVIRESGLWAPLGPEWDELVAQAPGQTAAELRAEIGDIGSVSDLIIEERDSRK
jgi:plasmid stability protein